MYSYSRQCLEISTICSYLLMHIVTNIPYSLCHCGDLVLAFVKGVCLIWYLCTCRRKGLSDLTWVDVMSLTFSILFES